MSLLEDSHANHSPLLEKEEEQKMIASSGMKLLELYPSKNPNGSLAKMLKGLLTSKTAWCSDRSTMTWKAKVSKCKVLLFQLAVSVHGTKEKEFGLLPTPTVGCEEGGEQSNRVERTKSGGFILRKKNKPEMTYGAKLSDAMLYLEKQKMYPTPTQDSASGQENPETLIKRKGLKQAAQHNLTAAVQMYPTPRARDHFGTVNPNQVSMNSKGWTTTRKGSGVRYGASLPDVVNKLHGGKLNPTFVEFLMGYPMNWTKIEQTELNHSETQSFHKSQGKSEKQ